MFDNKSAFVAEMYQLGWKGVQVKEEIIGAIGGGVVSSDKFKNFKKRGHHIYINLKAYIEVTKPYGYSITT